MISLWVSLLMISIIWIFGSLISRSFVIKYNCSIGFFLMMVLSLFIIDLMGLFFYTKIGSIISIGDLPTTNIIEPKSRGISSTFSYYSVRYFLIPAVVKPEVFSSAKPHSVLTTTCPCHHESPNDLTRKYDFYVYPNSIMTFFSKVNISHFFNDKKEADNLQASL